MFFGVWVIEILFDFVGLEMILIVVGRGYVMIMFLEWILYKGVRLEVFWKSLVERIVC